MITLHRLGHAAEKFHLNQDLIVTVEANPDTVITLTTGTKIVVAEPPERVVDAARAFRVGVLSDALSRSDETPRLIASNREQVATGLKVSTPRTINGA